MILSDNETKVDLLNNEAIAQTIVTLLRERPEGPITIGIHGDWFAGKSSVLEMIEGTFDLDDKVLCLKFNGWRFQGFEDAKIALIEGIVTGLIEERSLLTKAAEATKKILRRIDLLKAAKKIGGLVLTGYAAMHGADAHALAIPGIIATLEGWAADPSRIKTEEIKGVISGASADEWIFGSLRREEEKDLRDPDDVYIDVRKREEERIKKGLAPRIHFLDKSPETKSRTAAKKAK